MEDTTPARTPGLEGALNFREPGGYQTLDGRSVRWRNICRSGTTHALYEKDVAWLASEGIRYAYDLRSNKEREVNPNRLRDIVGVDYRY